jgi:hypothetical protein
MFLFFRCIRHADKLRLSPDACNTSVASRDVASHSSFSQQSRIGSTRFVVAVSRPSLHQARMGAVNTYSARGGEEAKGPPSAPLSLVIVRAQTDLTHGIL